VSYSGSGDSGHGAWRNETWRNQTWRNQTWRSDGGIPPHAFDPVTEPELFHGVPARRMVAFLIDLLILAIPIIVACLFIAVFGVVTLGLGWMLFWLVSPASVIWALVYYGATLGSAHSATLGMRMMNLEMRTWYGAPAYFVLGAMHAFLFWVSVSCLSPFVLLVGFFNGRRRLLHDMVLGTVVINNAVRIPAPQPARTF
jgi:uncharacterized RDD family membrane protein YckC